VTSPRYPFVRVQVARAKTDEAMAALLELGATGIEERDSTTLGGPKRGVHLVAFFDTAAEAKRVARALEKRSYRVTVDAVVGDEWRDAWKAHFKPKRVGQRLVVRPSWEPFKPLSDDVVVTIDPGRAFGSGLHETTRLVLREIDRRVRGGESVLDVGTGSGILSVAAVLLGARSAVAIDNDPDAVEVTMENASRNGVEHAIHASTKSLSAIRDKFDLVVANIEARVLIPMAPLLRSRVERTGVLVLSGLLRGQEAEIRAAYAPMRTLLTPFAGEWVAVVLAR
jgi:ribosomal protein L11 methyltransferase